MIFTHTGAADDSWAAEYDVEGSMEEEEEVALIANCLREQPTIEKIKSNKCYSIVVWCVKKTKSIWEVYLECSKSGSKKQSFYQQNIEQNI